MKDVLEKMESKMSPEAIFKAQLLAEQEILSIKHKKLDEADGFAKSHTERYTADEVFSRIRKRIDERNPI